MRHLKRFAVGLVGAILAAALYVAAAFAGMVQPAPTIGVDIHAAGADAGISVSVAGIVVAAAIGCVAGFMWTLRRPKALVRPRGN